MFATHLIFSLLPLADAATEPATPPADAAISYHFRWHQWLSYYDLHLLLAGIATFVLFLAVAWIIGRAIHRFLARYNLVRPYRITTLTLAIYFMLFAWHPGLMVDARDIGAIVIHKLFAAILLLVALRVIDILAIVPLMTRGGKIPLPRFVHQIINILIYALAALAYSSWAFDWNIDRFLAGSAVLSIVLGLALQETLGNFFSGMVLQASTPFQIGDWIDCGGIEGRVVDMNWRAVTLHTNQDNYVLIPNGMVSKDRIINYHSPKTTTGRSVKIGLDYNIPPNDARAVLLAAAMESSGVLPDPPPGVSLASFDDSAITYSVFFSIAHPQFHGAVENQVRINIWYRLKQAGYGIPFPVRTVEFINTERRAARDRDDSLARRRELFASISLLANLKPEQLTRLAQVTRDVVFAAGQTVFHQGDEGSSTYILRAGTVESTLKLADGRSARVALVPAVNMFGEYSATTGKPRPTTIAAVTDIQCIELKREHLQELLDSDPGLMAHMSQVVAERAAERARLMQEAGANDDAAHHAAPPHSVLDGMKRLFTRLHLPTLPK